MGFGSFCLIVFLYVAVSALLIAVTIILIKNITFSGVTINASVKTRKSLMVYFCGLGTPIISMTSLFM